MILPPGRPGVAFTDADDGDQRRDHRSRLLVSDALGIPAAWATVRQVHGMTVLEARTPGEQGEADALWTRSAALPLAVFTADCVGVVLHSPGGVGVAHAGWRGVSAGVVAALRDEMTRAGVAPTRAELGPGIGSCCYEVGVEVAGLFSGFQSETTWGTVSIDLVGAIGRQLEGLDVWLADRCTMHEDDWFSHRGNATPQRLATIGWVP